MSRQEIIQHIQSELRNAAKNDESAGLRDEALCQKCGLPIEPEGEEPNDYVVHRIPSHGEDGMNTVFYCSPSCFQDAMDDLFTDC